MNPLQKPPLARILVGICSARGNRERRNAIRETWLSRPVPGIECRFFVGGAEALGGEPDTVVLDEGDSDDEQPAKVRAFLAFALATADFDWLFKCDDGTYTALDRLPGLTGGGHDLVGDCPPASRGSPRGGAGCLLSRALVERLAADESLPARGPEDILTGEAAIRHGGLFHASKRLCRGHHAPPRRGNDMITARDCSPERLRAIHAALRDTPRRVFHVDHAGWNDRLELFGNGYFSRSSSACCGRWVEHGETLRLEWFDWAPEEAAAAGDGVYIGERMTLRPVPAAPSIPRRPAGKLCSAALAYPRMEMPFIAEWCEYHLALGVERVFLGLDINEEFLPPESLLTAKRPFPSLYRLDGSEGDIMAEFCERLSPFRKRLTLWLLRRDGPRMHAHCPRQEEVYRRVLATHREDYVWLAVHDIDEFLVPTGEETLTAALDNQGSHVAAVLMRQVICEARWTGQRIPRTDPVLFLHRRMKDPVPLPHGMKTITRMAAARDISIHQSAVYGPTACDDSILNYHFRGFPSATEIDTGYRLPVEKEEFDTVDRRPAMLLDRAKEASREPATTRAP